MGNVFAFHELKSNRFTNERLATCYEELIIYSLFSSTVQTALVHWGEITHSSQL